MVCLFVSGKLRVCCIGWFLCWVVSCFVVFMVVRRMCRFGWSICWLSGWWFFVFDGLFWMWVGNCLGCCVVFIICLWYLFFEFCCCLVFSVIICMIDLMNVRWFVIGSGMLSRFVLMVIWLCWCSGMVRKVVLVRFLVRVGFFILIFVLRWVMCWCGCRFLMFFLVLILMLCCGVGWYVSWCCWDCLVRNWRLWCRWFVILVIRLVWCREVRCREVRYE